MLICLFIFSLYQYTYIYIYIYVYNCYVVVLLHFAFCLIRHLYNLGLYRPEVFPDTNEGLLSSVAR